jgi:hypothetical protein
MERKRRVTDKNKNQFCLWGLVPVGGQRIKIETVGG